MIPSIDLSFDLVAFISVTAGVLFWIYKRILQPLYKGIKRMVDTSEKIDTIYHNMHTNGGTTLRDAVNRIENKLVTVGQKTDVYLQDAPQGIYETDKDGRCVNVNRTYCRILGRTEKESMGNGWFNSIADYDRERVVDSWQESITNGIEFTLRYDMLHSNGSVVSVQGKANPMFAPNGQIIGYLGTIEQI